MMPSTEIHVSTDQRDILCGRGRGLERYPGNKIFRSIIKDHASVYVDPKTSRSAKSRLVQRIAALLSSEDMRFLKKVKGGWQELDEYDAKLKVGHALRDAGVERRKKDIVKKEGTNHQTQQTHQDAALVSDEEDSSYATSQQSSEDQSSMDDDHSLERQSSISSSASIREDEVQYQDMLDVLPFEFVDKLQQTRFSITSFGSLDDIDTPNPALIEELDSDDSDSTQDLDTARVQGLFFDDGAEDVTTSVPKGDLDFDLSLSEVFLRFRSDGMEVDDVSLQDIDPDDWLTQ